MVAASPGHAPATSRRGALAVPETPRLLAGAQTALWLFLPPVFLLWLYSRSFRIWFRQDDFPLLGFARGVHSLHDFLRFLYVPYAQGTIRPLSERLPFLISWNLFGADCVPLRIFVFLTAAADTILMAIITRRITGSRLAGTMAAIFWAASASVVTPMTWNSAYNEVQYPLFLLGALALFIRFADTGESRYWWLQLFVFVVGFGSLENNIVYPGIAAAWALFAADRDRRRRLLASTIPLFVVSAAYYVIHMRIAPAPKTGIYAAHFDSRIARTFWEYWRWAFVAPEAFDFGMPLFWGKLILRITIACFAGFVLWQIYRRRTAVVFFLAWYLLTLGPMLLLPDRHTEYYLCGAVIGLAMIAGWGVALALQSAWPVRILMLVPVAAWFTGMIPAVRAAEKVYVAESKASKNLVLGVVQAHERHPERTLLLSGVTQEAYDAAIYESGFRAFGIENVYLTPESRDTIHPDPNDVNYEGMLVDPAVARHAVENDEALVFDFSPGHLKNVTTSYRKFAIQHFPADALPRRIEAANPLYAYLLGPEWLEPDGFVRWMAGHATLTIAGPKSDRERLFVSGFCWDEQLRRGPVHIALAADGIPLGSRELRGPAIRFDTSFPVPASLAGKSSVQIAIGVSPVATVGDRQYGAMIESVSIH